MNVDFDLAAHEIALIAAREYCINHESDKKDVNAFACDMAAKYLEARETAKEALVTRNYQKSIVDPD